jgi:aerobic carbon-monoxide dehydrogenase small subunit
MLIDGKPQRSCLAFTVDCDGATIRSIEDFDDDPLMGELRDAFSASHALQCGFCTPGMLASARDIVSRLGEVSEHRIREELSGNICRCTGYVGIVEAIRTVSLGKQPAIAAAAHRARAEDHRTRWSDRSGRRYPGCSPTGVGVAHDRRRRDVD